MVIGKNISNKVSKKIHDRYFKPPKVIECCLRYGRVYNKLELNINTMMKRLKHKDRSKYYIQNN